MALSSLETCAPCEPEEAAVIAPIATGSPHATELQAKPQEASPVHALSDLLPSIHPQHLAHCAVAEGVHVLPGRRQGTRKITELRVQH